MLEASLEGIHLSHNLGKDRLTATNILGSEGSDLKWKLPEGSPQAPANLQGCHSKKKKNLIEPSR